jgi:hypothetical protein
MDDLSWIPDKWWYLVTGLKRRQKVPEKINRHQFEMGFEVQWNENVR